MQQERHDCYCKLRKIQTFLSWEIKKGAISRFFTLFRLKLPQKLSMKAEIKICPRAWAQSGEEESWGVADESLFDELCWWNEGAGSTGSAFLSLWKQDLHLTFPGKLFEFWKCLLWMFFLEGNVAKGIKTTSSAPLPWAFARGGFHMDLMWTNINFWG